MNKTAAQCSYYRVTETYLFKKSPLVGDLASSKVAATD